MLCHPTDCFVTIKIKVVSPLKKLTFNSKFTHHYIDAMKSIYLIVIRASDAFIFDVKRNLIYQRNGFHLMAPILELCEYR